MIFQLKRISFVVLLATGATASLANNARIFYDIDGNSMSAKWGLNTVLTNAGFTVTANTTGAPGSTNLSSYAQVWDVRYADASNGVSTGPLGVQDRSTYLNYLQGGGALFLIGENRGFMARNNSIIAFVSEAGGGNAVFANPTSDTQTVQGSAATTPNSVSTMKFPGSGAFSSVGTGTCLTKDSGNKCVAVGYGHNKLANAANGTLVVVMDINFLQGTLSGDRLLFTQNLIAYLESGGGAAGTFVPVSNKVTGGVGATLDGLLAASSINANMAAAVGSLSALDDAQRAIAMNRLTPAANNSIARLGIRTMSAGLSTVAGRLEGIRNSGALAWAEPKNEQLTLAAAGTISGLLEKKGLRHGVWGKVFGGDIRQDAQDGFAGYKASTWGVTFGADTRLEQGTVVGGALTYASTGLSQQNFLSGSGNDLQNYQLTGYASHDFGAWYLEGLFSYGQQRYKSHRDTGVTGVAKATYDGNISTVRIGVGMPFAINENAVVTPFASVEYNNVKQNHYQEHGADVLNLAVSATEAERLRTGLGVRFSGEFSWGKKQIQPSIHVQWLHDHKNDGVATTATFTGGGAAFVTPGQKLPRDTGNIGGSVMFSVAKSAAVSLHYDYEGASEYSSQTGQIIGQLWF